MKTFFAALAFLLLTWTPASAVEPAPELFAYGAQLEVRGQQPFYELELPLEVYRAVTRPDLGDIRVFNGSGQVVPHALRRPEQSRVREGVDAVPLPFFPLHGVTEQIGEDLSIHVERNPQGTIVDVRAAGPEAPAAGSPVRAYLVDAGNRQRAVTALELTWTERTADFLGEIRVEASDDLRSWRPLTTAAVARLSHQGLRLDRSRIELPRFSARYLRLSWPESQSALELSGLRAMAYQETEETAPLRRWFKVAAVPDTDRPQSFVADLGGFVPVDTIQIQLSEKNSMAAARLASGDGATAANREDWRGLLYTLQVDGRTLTNPAISIPATASRTWTLSITDSESPLRAAPQLEFGWRPARLVFLAQGSGPFVLAYGSREIEPATFSVAALLQKAATTAENTLQTAKIAAGPQFLLGGESRLLPNPPPFPWKTWLLWSVLVIGVLLIAWMALRLYRQLQEQDKKHPY